MRVLAIGVVILSLLLCAIPPAISCVGSECPVEPIWGTAYDGTTPSSMVGIYSGNWIKYYNPLTSQYSGTYGVNNGTVVAGYSSDTGGGYGYYDSNDSLMMYLQFDLSGLPVSPGYAGYMKFHFIDLDLQGVNDPGGFNESIEINFTPDGGSSWSAPYGTTTAITDSASNYQVAGGYYYQSITISDIVLDSQNPLLARLDFATRSDFTGTNTKEWLKAELCLQPVPLPAAIYLLGAGFIGLAGLRKKIKG